MVSSKLFRRIELQILMCLTARAVGQKSIRTWTLTNTEALRMYAEFTRDHLRDGISDQVLQRMNNDAYRLGRCLRMLFFWRGRKGRQRLIGQLYRHIGITIEGDVPGRLCFRHCYFSSFYTPAICLAASALDDGIIRGLTGCGSLTFLQRITEGHPYCIATMCHSTETPNHYYKNDTDHEESHNNRKRSRRCYDGT